MRDKRLEALVGRRGEESIPFYALMSRRIRNVLLVSSLYDSYTLEEDGRFTEVLFSEYLSLNLRYAPRVVRASTGTEALERLESEDFDLVISLINIGDMNCGQLADAVAEKVPGLPFLVLAYTGRDLRMLEAENVLRNVHRVYVWQGDVRLLLAMIKSLEDRMNAEHDSRAAGVKNIILVEDSARFCSSYLPMLYTELMQQTQALMTEGVNQIQRLMRMRARPKILHAVDYEEGMSLYRSFREDVLGVILDVRFNKGGVKCSDAGFLLAEEILADNPDCPILIQSSEEENRDRANELGAAFINKNSKTLLADLRNFMRNYLGFGDFVFRNPDGREEARASDLREMRRALGKISDECLYYHASRNDFSTWLMARTEFELAKALRPQKVEDFESADELREYLISSLSLWMERNRAGQVEDFSRETFDDFTEFSKIGSGSLGGKGRGLAFVNALLNYYRIDQGFEDVKIHVPPTAVIATGVFDEFMERPGLKELVFSRRESTEESGLEWDRKVARMFLGASMPGDVTDMLEAFLDRVEYPLAVRSSSLLEDSPANPFAGIYSTYMLPNNDPDPRVRLEQLVSAVKLVFASTYFDDSMAYIESTPNRLEEEKMAVVIQQLVGRKYGDLFYPNLAGVAKSYNYYPLEGLREENGIASVALGFGSTVVDGGKCIRFSPAAPGRLYQFSGTEEFLRNSQRWFFALKMDEPGGFDMLRPGRDMNLVRCDLERAQADGTLAPVGSVYSPEDDMIVDGTFRPGIKLVTMAGVLKGDLFPLAPLLERLLEVGKLAFSSDVEMEFAVNLGNPRKGEMHEFGFLQIRPMGQMVGAEPDVDDIGGEKTLCISHSVLGFGIIDNIQDIIYVSPGTFDRSKSVSIAGEIEQLNARLKKAGRVTLLVGPGRWGSSDSWLGIPVRWGQISTVRCIVETPLDDMSVTPSQGTHFFHNITSLGIGYLTVGRHPDDYVDYDFLNNAGVPVGEGFIRHIRLNEPLRILVNARVGKGVVLLP